VRKEKRKKEVKRRKNFLPTLIIIFISWGTAFGMVYFVDPAAFGAIPIFFLVVFTGLLFTFSTIFANTRRGFIVSSALVLFLFLRYLGVGNILNFLLITGLAITAEIYFSTRA
jgi:hypothetical protein